MNVDKINEIGLEDWYAREGIFAAELAKRLGIDPRRVSQWKKAGRVPEPWVRLIKATKARKKPLKSKKRGSR